METKKNINNAFYEELEEGWYEKTDHPIALLRSENSLRNPWIADLVSQKFGRKASILDIGCGAGFLANFLAKEGHKVHGIDLSEKSLKKAKEKDSTRTVYYQKADAYLLPYENESFDVVCAMDILEHVESPEKLIKETSRVLKKGGLFFFHTFNRSLLSWLLVIKGVEICVRNTPENMHVYSLFLKPSEVQSMCLENNLDVVDLIGLAPDMWKASFWKMLFSGKVGDDFKFRFTTSLKAGYSGYAIKHLS